MTNQSGNGTIISEYRYSYDKAGNQLTKSEAKGTTTYAYDYLNRLDSVTEPDGKKTTYTYDGAGNRSSELIEKGLVSGITIYNYNASNRLISTVSSDGTQTMYLYDKNGNLTSKTKGMIKTISAEELTKEELPNFDLVIRRDSEGGTGSENLTLYSYDHYNRLIKAKTQNASSSYQYNAQGYRVEKQVNGNGTNFLYEGDKVVLETDTANNQTAFQGYGTSLVYRSTSASSELGAMSYYYLYNAHGDVTSLIDTTGNVAVSYDYDAFGNILSQIGTADNHITYAGYQYDKESGLYYLNARYYDSVTARFISEDDPKYSSKNDPLSLNLYTYCINNPIMYIDPSGHRIDTEGDSSGKWKPEKNKKTSNITTSLPVKKNTVVITWQKRDNEITFSANKDKTTADKTTSKNETKNVAKSTSQVITDAVKKVVKAEPAKNILDQDKKHQKEKKAQAAVAGTVLVVGLSFLPVSGDVMDATDVVKDTVKVIADPSPMNQANLALDLTALAIPCDGPVNNMDTALDVSKKLGKSSDDIAKGGTRTIEFNGKTVTIDNSTFDPNLIDKQGRTNIQRMEQGLSPIGTDGKSVNIHHIDQTNDGPVMEITATEHQTNYSNLHTNTGQAPTLIDRSAFNGWRNEYWKWRSNNTN